MAFGLGRMTAAASNVADQPPTFTAAVNSDGGAPTGQVELWANGNWIGNVSLTAKANGAGATAVFRRVRGEG